MKTWKIVGLVIGSILVLGILLLSLIFGSLFYMFYIIYTTDFLIENHSGENVFITGYGTISDGTNSDSGPMIWEDKKYPLLRLGKSWEYIPVLKDEIKRFRYNWDDTILNYFVIKNENGKTCEIHNPKPQYIDINSNERIEKITDYSRNYTEVYTIPELKELECY